MKKITPLKKKIVDYSSKKNIIANYSFKSIIIYVSLIIIVCFLLAKLYLFYLNILTIQNELYQQKQVIFELNNTLRSTLKELASQIDTNKELVASQLLSNKQALLDQNANNKEWLQGMRSTNHYPHLAQPVSHLSGVLLNMLTGMFISYVVKTSSIAILKEMTNLVKLGDYIPAWLNTFFEDSHVIEFKGSLLETPIVGRLTMLDGKLLKFLVRENDNEDFVDISIFLHKAACNISVPDTTIEYAMNLIDLV